MARGRAAAVPCVLVGASGGYRLARAAEAHLGGALGGADGAALDALAAVGTRPPLLVAAARAYGGEAGAPPADGGGALAPAASGPSSRRAARTAASRSSRSPSARATRATSPTRRTSGGATR